MYHGDCVFAIDPTCNEIVKGYVYSIDDKEKTITIEYERKFGSKKAKTLLKVSRDLVTEDSYDIKNMFEDYIQKKIIWYKEGIVRLQKLLPKAKR
jgi:hypothetical protein